MELTLETLELKLKKDVLIVEAPLDAYDVSIGTHCIGVRTNENVEKDTNGFYHIYKKGLFFGDIDMKLEFLCKGSELTEEMASELVDYWQNMANDGFIYENYKTNLPKKKKALESFISAVENKGFYWLKNPIDEPNKYVQKCMSFENLSNQFKLFDEKEEKTFRNPLIFVKK